MITLITSKNEYLGLSTDDYSFIKTDGAKIFLTDIGTTLIYHNGGWTNFTPTTTTMTVMFQNAVTSIGQGNVLDIGGFKTLKIDIYGTSVTSRTVQFYSINSNNELLPLLGFNTSTGTLATSTTGVASETWVFDITGLNQVCMKIDVFSGINTTINGRMVA